MKLYIKAAVSVENLKTQFAKEIPDDMFRELIELDPTSNYDSGKGGKYCPWIFRQYNGGKLKESDFDNLKDALDMFSKQYRKYPNPDIGSYKTVNEFLEATHAVGNRELTEKEKAKMLKKHAHNTGDADKKFLVADGDWEVWQPLTYPGSISLARDGGTKASWCTAYEGNDHYWKSYTSKGPLYIFLNKANPKEKYQLHIPTQSWYDIRDNSQGMAAFYRFCDKHPVIGEYFKVYSKNGITYCANEIVGYTDGAEEVIIDEGVTMLPSFSLPKSVKHVVLPDSMTTIKNNAFANSNIQSIEFHNVDTIESGAFEGCKLQHIDLSTVTKIGAKAFRNCGDLQTAIFNTDGVNFGAYSFQNNTSLNQSVTLRDEDLLSIGVFDNCPELTIVWDAEDADYDFVDIKELQVNTAACPTLVKCNDGYVPIKNI